MRGCSGPAWHFRSQFVIVIVIVIVIAIIIVVVVVVVVVFSSWASLH